MLFIIGALLLCNFPLHETRAILDLIKERDSFNLNFIINKIYQEKKIEKTLIINNYNRSFYTADNCISSKDIKIFSNISSVIITNEECVNQITVGDLFMIVCLPRILETEHLDKMVFCLGRKRDSRILFIWNHAYTKHNKTIEAQEKLDQQQLELFEYCERKRLINVISIYRDYEIDGHFYTFSYFPEIHLQRKTLGGEYCFPDRVKDIKGASIRVIPDQLEPWSMAWYDQNGRLRVGGYITKILEAFVRRVNGTITYPIPIKPNDSLSVLVWLPYLRNDSVDIVAGIAPPSLYSLGHDVTSVLQPVDWNIMLPFQTMPDSELILYLINSIVGASVLILLIVFSVVFALEGLIWRRRFQRDPNCPAHSFQLFIWIFINVVLRNVIGLPTSLQIRATAHFITRFLYVLLFLCGIFMSTLISATLNSYLTSPLVNPRKINFQELIRSGIYVKTSQFEYDILYNYVSAEDLPKIKKILIPIESFAELRDQHTNSDSRYGFTILSTSWDVIDRYQSYLPKPLYYVTEDLSFAKSLPMSIPIQEYSIYKEALSNMIDSVHSSGLTQLWTSQAYDDMMAAKLLDTTTHIKESRQNVIDLKYLYWLWWLYGIGVCSSILVFFVEIWCYKRNVRTKRNFRMQRKRSDEHINWCEEESSSL
ncbi:uncharacterized protein [Eurosta solidaginis]|uniref:uncharacterized protein n=1 Tax=Eurosta solidaginis TaxID=178769 RepID=UPI0035307D46